MFDALLDMARSGGLDGYLLTVDGKFYQTDFTKPLLFLNEKALPDRADELQPERRPVGHDEQRRSVSQGKHGCGSTPSGIRYPQAPTMAPMPTSPSG